MKAISENELLRFVKDHNVSPRKLADWRSEGLFPNPIRSKGLGRGKGWTYEYSRDALGRVEMLIDLTGRYPRSFDEIHWKLWLAGCADQWPYVRDLLVIGFPPDADPPDTKALHDNTVGFLELWKKRLKRYSPFPHMEKHQFTAGMWYLLWPYLYGAIYPSRAEDEENFESLFSPEIRQLHVELERSKFNNLKRLRQALENAKEEDVSKFTPVMQSFDEKIERPGNKKTYRLLHLSIPLAKNVPGVEDVSVQLIWMMRASVLATLCSGSPVVSHVKDKKGKNHARRNKEDVQL